MDARHIEILQSMPVLGGIRADNLELLLQYARTVERSKDAYFFREDDKGSSMFVLETGKVAILKTHRGREYLLKNMGIGDCFGEMELIDLQPRGASALAIEDSRAIELSGATLQKLYRHDPHQFALIHMNMGREVTRRLREMDRKMFDLQVRTEAMNDE